MINKETISHNKGFTLVELMATVLLSAVVATVLYAMYQNQHKLHRTQEAVVDMQQNGRAAMYLLGQELRMAGYNPLETAGTGIQTTSNAITLQFTQDLNEDGDTADANENVTLTWDSTDDAGETPGEDCTADNPCITRTVPGGGAQPFINDIDFFDLVYLTYDPAAYDPTTTPPTPPFTPITLPLTAGDIDNLDMVQISLLVRSSVNDSDFFNNLRYDPPGFSATAPNGGARYNDGFRRRMITTTILLRNNL